MFAAMADTKFLEPNVEDSWFTGETKNKRVVTFCDRNNHFQRCYKTFFILVFKKGTLKIIFTSEL
jgi:hypothetical protein